MPELRVPPAVSFTFERVAIDVCDQAGLETFEWAAKAKELVNHLEQRWCEGVELGMSTDAAQKRALDLFGPPQEAGRWLAQGMIRRWLSSPSRHEFRVMMFTTNIFLLDLTFTGLNYDWKQLSEHEQGLGLFVWSSFSSISLLLHNRRTDQDRFWPRLAAFFKVWSFLNWPIAAAGILNLLLAYWLAEVVTLESFCRFGASEVYLSALNLWVAFSLLLFTAFGVIMWASVIFDFSGKRRRQAERNLALRLVK